MMRSLCDFSSRKEKRFSHRSAQVSRERDSHAHVQKQGQTGEPSKVQAHEFHPLEKITSGTGDAACVSAHVSVIQRSGTFHPMNEQQKIQRLLKLQQHYGNRFVQRVIAEYAIQPRLPDNQPGDIYEQEANRTADAVMRMPQPQVQRQSVEEETPPMALQFQVSNRTEPSMPSTIVHDVLRSPGQPLDSATRAFMEPRFGHDFSRVRVHTDTRASDTARALEARAFTVGHDIVFSAGQYKPQTSEGGRLLAHELTHVVQQAGLPSMAKPPLVKTHISSTGLRVARATDYCKQAQNAQTLDERVRNGLICISRSKDDEATKKQKLKILFRNVPDPQADYVHKLLTGANKAMTGYFQNNFDTATQGAMLNILVLKASGNTRIVSWDFLNYGTTSPRNCCSKCSGEPLGVDTRFYNKYGLNSFTNSMQLEAFIANHKPGTTYDIKREVESTSWEKKGDAWVVAEKPTPPGSKEDPKDIDGCPTPTIGPASVNQSIFSFDSPGFIFISNYDPDATDMVIKLSFREFVEINSPGGKLIDPNGFYWHSITWVTRKDGRWIVDTAKSEIKPGKVTVGTTGP